MVTVNRRTFLKAAGVNVGTLALAGDAILGAETPAPQPTQGAAAPGAPDVVVIGAGAFGGWTALYLRDGLVSWSLDRRSLFFLSNRAGSMDLWQQRVTDEGQPEGDATALTVGIGMRQLTTDRAPDSAPRSSPDGQQIAFQSSRSGNRDIWVMPSEGGAATQLTHDPGLDMFPSWSPDGRNIAFYSGRTGNISVFVVPASGGEAGRITTDASQDYFPQWSPNGNWIAFASYRGDRVYRLWRMPAVGGVAQQMMEAPAYFFRWSVDGKRIYFMGHQRGNNDLWDLTLDGRAERRLTRFSQKPGSLGDYTLAVDNQYLYFTWRNDLGDIWVMDVVGDGGTE